MAGKKIRTAKFLRNCIIIEGVAFLYLSEGDIGTKRSHKATMESFRLLGKVVLNEIWLEF